MTPRILPLAAARKCRTELAVLLECVWPGYYGPGCPGSARDDLAARDREHGLPLGLVALRENDEVLGTVALTETSHGADEGEGPWLGGLAVAPLHRRRGVGAALVEAAEVLARDEGHPVLYSTTRNAEALLRARDWTPLRDLPDGHAVLRREIRALTARA